MIAEVERSHWRRWVAAAIGALVLIALAFVGGRMTVVSQELPSTTSAEAGFARDMQTHHQQAVELSMIVRDRTTDEDVRRLAYDIALTQSQQAGQLYGWLTQWGLPQAPPEPSMTWMSRPTLDGAGHEGMDMGSDATADATHTPGGPMPGMATPEQIAELESLSGVEAERAFLTLMIAHHKGGVQMAEALLARSTNESAVRFASSVVAAQTSEIQLMEDMLAARG